MAAQVMQGRGDDVTGSRLWSVTVFFESYLNDGATVTQEDFGPKEPVNLKAVSK